MRTGGEAGKPAELGEIRGEVDALHARHGARGFEVLDFEARMGVRAAQENRVQRVIAPRPTCRRRAADQPDVLDALDALADAEFHQLSSRRFPLLAGRTNLSAGVPSRHDLDIRGRARVRSQNLPARAPFGQRSVNPQDRHLNRIGAIFGTPP